MGMQSAQSAQPISQQQPGGKDSQQYQSNPQGGKGMAQPQPQSGLDQNAINANPQGFAEMQQGAQQQEQQHPGSTYLSPMGGSNGRPQGFDAPMGGPNGQPQGKSQGGFASNMQMPPPPQQPQQYQGKNGTTNSATSGQPQMGQPNTYSNTVGPWDNSNNQTQVQSGKGKGH